MDSRSALAIEASGLVKAFGRTHPVDGVDLAVPAGSVYGFLGPNGAGKTTTIRMLATLLQPDAGMARVLGHDVVAEADAVRGRIALTGQYASVDEDLTGLENLVLLARLLGHPRTHARARAGELLDAERVLSQALDVPVQLEADPAALSARVADPQRVALALAELTRAGIAVTDFALGQPSLDEVFLALTGHPTQHDAASKEEAA